MGNQQKRRAIISVYKKDGIGVFAKKLQDLGFEIVSTGGTAKLLEQQGIAVTEVASLTGFPECLGGRVKTLHPLIHAGILARNTPEDQKTLEDLKMTPIDLVCVNLYPFEETLKTPGVSVADLVEKIDIGGPTMLRAAAKNFSRVYVLTDPDDYDRFFEVYEREDGKKTGADSPMSQAQEEALAFRRYLAGKVFHLCAGYDSLISSFFAAANQVETQNVNEAVPRIKEQMIAEVFDSNVFAGTDRPKRINLSLGLKEIPRYGENPIQAAAVYESLLPNPLSLLAADQLNGIALSYNNLADADSAISSLYDFGQEKPTVVVLKHATPCGIARADRIEDAFAGARDSDPVSIYGGIVAQNRPVTLAEAELLKPIFLEIIIAPAYEPDALALLKEKKKLRILQLPALGTFEGTLAHPVMKQIIGGLLVQEQDSFTHDGFEVASKAQPDPADKADYLFAMKAVKQIKSNAILLAKNEATLGIGTGQPNRVTSCKLAIMMAGEKAKGSILASDAFLPFDDTARLALEAGVKGIIQPGGSIRDEDSLKFVDDHGMVMIYTGQRHFKH